MNFQDILAFQPLSPQVLPDSAPLAPVSIPVDVSIPAPILNPASAPIYLPLQPSSLLFTFSTHQPLSPQVLPDSAPLAPVSIPVDMNSMPSSPVSISTPTVNPVSAPISLSPQPSSVLFTPSTQIFLPPPANHAIRNALKSIQPSRKFAGTSDAQKATLKIRQEANAADQKVLNTELSALLTNHHMELTDLAGRHGKKIEYIEKLIGSSKHYKTKRNVNIENAKLHAKATEVNAG
jgi:hypothetical protein